MPKDDGKGIVLKRCPRCKEEKDLQKGGYCPPCAVAVQKEYRAKNREHVREYERNYRARRVALDAQAVSLDELGKRLRSLYGITVEQYGKLLADQGGVCGICGAEPPLDGRRLAVDHDHSCCPGKKTCGKCIRGLLCLNCNVKMTFIELFGVKAQEWMNRRVVVPDV